MLKQRSMALDMLSSKMSANHGHGHGSDDAALSKSSAEEYTEASESSSEGETSQAPSSPRPQPARNKSSPNKTRPRRRESDVGYIVPESKTSWYEFDLAVLFALLSPLGTVLTGGDHVKNLLLLALMAWYLHQVIEVPWRLYTSSLPRRPSLPPNLISDDPADLERQLATSSLRNLEIFFLLLTLVSPFGGAILLQRIAPLLTGSPPSESHFSIGLFVLAAGLRPWRHVIARLSARTTELHDQIHYPPPASHSSAIAESAKERTDELEQKLADMVERLERTERTLSNLKSKVAKEIDEVYAYTEDIDRAERKLEKRTEKMIREIRSQSANIDTKIDKENWSFAELLSGFFASDKQGGSPTSSSSPTSTPGGTLKRRCSSQSGLETIPEEGHPAVTPSSSSSVLPPSYGSPPPGRTRRAPPPSSLIGRLFMFVTMPVRSVFGAVLGPIVGRY